jgi:hypothetical protein
MKFVAYATGNEVQIKKRNVWHPFLVFLKKSTIEKNDKSTFAGYKIAVVSKAKTIIILVENPKRILLISQHYRRNKLGNEVKT